MGLYDNLLKSYLFNMAAGGHLEFWWLDWSKYKSDARNWFSMPKLVGKVVLPSFPYQFVFKLHFQYGHWHHFGFWLLTNSAAVFAWVMGAKVFLNTSKSSNQVSNLNMLSVVTGPPDCTQLIVRIHVLVWCYKLRICHFCSVSLFCHRDTSMGHRPWDRFAERP